MLVGISVPSAMTAHAFHALAGFALASTFIVAGLIYGPEAERGRFDGVSWGVLAGYLFGAFLLVLTNRHETLTLLTLFALAAATHRGGLAQRSGDAGRAGRGAASRC